MNTSVFRSTTLFILLVSFFSTSNAQEVYNLDQCVEYALRHNPDLRKAGIQLNQNEAKLNRDRAMQLPGFSAFASQGHSFGNSLDYTTYEYVKDNTRSNYYALNTDVTLFNGFRIRNTINSSKHDLLGSKYNLQAIEEQLKLDISAAYLSILMKIEQVHFAESQIALSEKQKDRIRILVEAGKETKSKIYEIDAQLANDQVALVDAQNQLDMAYLGLKQLMNFELSDPLQIEEIEFDPMEYSNYLNDNIKEVIDSGLNHLPQIKQAEEDLKSAQYSMKASKALRYPSLSASGSMSSRYSNATFIPGSSPDPYFDQINNNFGQNVNFGLNIPIFNNLQNTYAIKSAENNVSNAEIILEESRIRIKNEIYTAYWELKSAAKKFEAAQKNLKAQQLLFDQSEIKLHEGAMNFIEWQTVKSNLSKAQSEYLKSKFDYLYRIKLYEYFKEKAFSN